MTEQEVINQDGEETIEDFEQYFGEPLTAKESFATLGISILMTGILGILIVSVVSGVQFLWRLIEKVV